MSKQLQSNALPYVQAYIEKLAEYRLKPTELAVYLSLLSFTSKDDPTAFPSTKAIAERVHVGVRTVKQALDRLEEVRLITRQHRRRKDGTRTSSLYWVRAVFVAADPPFEPEADEQSAENGKVQNLHPAQNDKVQNPHLAHGKQSAESAPHEPEPLLTRTTTPPADAGSVSAEGKSRFKSFAEQHPDLFDAELEDTKRAAVADLVADGAKRYINNTLKDQLERTVAHIFQTGGGEARVIARMLRGRPKKDDGQAWHDAAVDFIDAEVDSDELLAWAQWYERKNPDTTLPKTPHKLAGSILYWRENAKRESSRTGSEYYGGYKIVG